MPRKPGYQQGVGPYRPDEVRAIRERAGLTQAEVGLRLSIDQSEVSRVETGRRGVTGALAHRWQILLDDLSKGT